MPSGTDGSRGRHSAADARPCPAQTCRISGSRGVAEEILTVRLEFVVRLRLGAGPGPGSGRPTAHGSDRQRPPSVHCRRPMACGPPMMRACAPRCSRPGSRQASAQDHGHSRTAHGREILAVSSRLSAPRMAWMSAALGLFGPGFLGHGLDENRRRYWPRTNAR
jgi:hypothetical protein